MPRRSLQPGGGVGVPPGMSSPQWPTPTEPLRGRGALVVLLAILPLLTACWEGGERRRAVELDTLSSGVVVVQNAEVGLWDSTTRWRPVEVLRLGGVGSSPAKQFGRVVDYTIDDLGRLYVLDGEAGEIQVFDREGSHIRTLGSSGEGPGELLGPRGLAWGPDGHLWVPDRRNARYTVFDTTGTLVTTHRRGVTSLDWPWRGGFGPEGQLYDVLQLTAPSDSEWRGRLVLHSVDEEVVPTDTFDLPAFRERELYDIPAQGGALIWHSPVPFTPELQWSYDGRAGIWFGVSDDFHLVHRSLDGDTLRIVNRVTDPRPVTEENRTAVRSRYAELYGEEAVKQVDLSRMPEDRSAYDLLLVDTEGYLWLSEPPPSDSPTDPQPRTFHVFDPEGRYLGNLQLDIVTHPAPRIIHDRVIGIETDELGVQEVVVYGLENRTGGS